MAGHSDQMRNDALNAVAANSGANYIGLHTADPGTTGASEVTGGNYARQQATPPQVSAVGTVSFPQVGIPVPGGVKVTYWARYKTSAGGAPYDSGLIPNGGESFANPGTLYLNMSITQGV